MRLRAFLAAAVVLTMATSAQAAKLVVMAVNTNPGIGAANAAAHVFTIGVQVTAADVAANPGSTLLVQNITFAGTGSVCCPGWRSDPSR